MNDKQLSWEEAVLWLKRQPDQQELVVACFYDDPPKKSAERYYHSSEWQAVKRLLAPIPYGKVLDIGAGRGISSYAFALDGWAVTSLEPDPSNVVGTGVIRELVEPQLNMTIVEDFGESLPFNNDHFDLVYGRAVLHHSDNLIDFCREVARVLKPGGKFLFTREHVISKEEDLENFLSSHPLHFLYKGEYAYLANDYEKALTDAGLSLLSVLKPTSSDINLFPQSKTDLINKIRKRSLLPWPRFFIEKVLLPFKDKNNNTPGRLYSFYGCK